MDCVKTAIRSEKGYYIGDICYVLSDATYDHVWGDKYHYQDGEIFINDKDYFVVFTTGIGDGMYEDTRYRYSFPVDAGVIGMIPAEILEKYGKPELMKDGKLDVDCLNHCGTYIPVDKPTGAYFEAEILGGGWDRSTHYDIVINDENIEIYTNPREDPEYEEDEDDDEYDDEDDEYDDEDD